MLISSCADVTREENAGMRNLNVGVSGGWGGDWRYESRSLRRVVRGGVIGSSDLRYRSVRGAVRRRRTTWTNCWTTSQRREERFKSNRFLNTVYLSEGIKVGYYAESEG
jgi:hypothetical protein